jgi:hypothetical protein
VGVLRRFRWAAILTVIVLLECGLLAVNGGRCPLTDLAARFTVDRNRALSGLHLHRQAYNSLNEKRVAEADVGDVAMYSAPLFAEDTPTGPILMPGAHL